jgi:glycine/D-amino acid oxidase-like deaminating enzyme
MARKPSIGGPVGAQSRIRWPRARPPIEGEGVVYWLEEAMALDPGDSCPPLAGTVHADVCIVGGGYMGLWTAIELLQNAPDTRVVLLEATSCGFAQSGRNGGWATGWHDELDALVARFGVDEGLRLAARSSWAVDRLEELCGTFDIDCHLRRQGATKAAVTQATVSKWDKPLRICDELGRAALFTRVDGAEIRRRTGSPVPLAGVCQTDAAVVQPALLVRGLRRVALQLGATIYEGTPMVSLDRGAPARVRTRAGHVVADRAVLATGASMARIRELRRSIVPVGSTIVVTEPLGERLRDKPFADGEGIGDGRLTVHYMQITPGGRLVFGRGGGPLGPAGRILPAHWYDERTVRSVIGDLRRWFPDLADARITHAWGGPVDRAPGHFPFLGQLGDHGTVHYVCGLSGQGVAQSAYLARVLARSVLGIDDADTRSPLTSGPPAYLPPEPIRTVGGIAVRGIVETVEAVEDRGHHLHMYPLLRRLIATTVPAWLEPRPRA